MLHLALRNLFQNRTQFVISVSGIALALVLILALDAIFSGVESQMTTYIDHSGADVFVSQTGVRNMHMTSSTLPLSVVAQVQAIPGVAAITPIRYVTGAILVGQVRQTSFIFGLPPDATSGLPWRMAEGVTMPAAGEAVMDRGLAAKSGLHLGDSVKILGRDFKIAGLSEDTASLLNVVTFITTDDFASAEGDSQSVSFVLVKVKPGESARAVAAQIETTVSGVTAQTRQAFSDQERKVVSDMSTDVLTIMNFIALLIGLAIMALTIFTATFARRAEYGVLKALGARNSDLYRIVLVQSAVAVGIGFALGLVFTVLLSAAVPVVMTNLALEVTGSSLFKVIGVSLVIAAISAVAPIRQIAGRDPALVFRGGK